jgi:hypothetical protein
MGMDFRPLTEKVSVGGHEFTVSALPCGVVRREVLPLAQALGGAAGDPLAFLEGDAFARMLAVCHLSVSKADPSITPEALEGGLMLGDAAALFCAVVRVSGLTREGPAPGEASGPRSISGAASTGSSQPPPAGRTPTSTGASRSPRRRT